MFTVPFRQIHIHETRGPDGPVTEWTAEASELGLPPGQWPEFIAVMHDARPKEGALFCRDATHDGTAVPYRTKSGVTLTVFND